MVQASTTSSYFADPAWLANRHTSDIRPGSARYSSHITGATGATVTLIPSSEFTGGRVFLVENVYLYSSAAGDFVLSTDSSNTDKSQYIAWFKKQYESSITTSIPISSALYALPNNAAETFNIIVTGRWI